MEIRRQKEVVEAFHYDMRLPNQEVETDLKVGFSPLKETIENYPNVPFVVGARLEFRLVFDTYVLSGSVSQINHILNRKIEGQNDVTQEEVDELVAPLFFIPHIDISEEVWSSYTRIKESIKTDFSRT
ncbi:hypothetical protein EfmAA96_16200 [Enterococcus faecium]|nr:hypothetical protein EfmAA96_16200 [Enterococcus faecium]